MGDMGDAVGSKRRSKKKASKGRDRARSDFKDESSKQLCNIKILVGSRMVKMEEAVLEKSTIMELEAVLVKIHRLALE